MTWRDEAACVGADPELFDGDGWSIEAMDQDEDTINRYCNRCPSKAECGQDALKLGPRDQWGIRGGMSQNERRILLGATIPSRVNRRNGTAVSRDTARDEQRMKLYDMGWSDSMIGRELGVAAGTIQDWRTRRGLRPNYLPGSNTRPAVSA